MNRQAGKNPKINQANAKNNQSTRTNAQSMAKLEDNNENNILRTKTSLKVKLNNNNKIETEVSKIMQQNYLSSITTYIPRKTQILIDSGAIEINLITRKYSTIHRS